MRLLSALKWSLWHLGSFCGSRWLVGGHCLVSLAMYLTVCNALAETEPRERFHQSLILRGFEPGTEADTQASTEHQPLRRSATILGG
eukprot:1910452-Amphidinium_carterae.2